MKSANRPLLTAPLNDPETRERYGIISRQILCYLWSTFPKRGARYYLFFVFLIGLLVTPKALETRSSRAINPFVGLLVSLTVAGGTGFMSNKFAEYAQTLSDEKTHQHVTAKEAIAAERAVRRTHIKADVEYKKHQLIQQLPDEVKAMLKPVNSEQTTRSEADDLANSLIANMKRPSTQNSNPAPEPSDESPSKGGNEYVGSSDAVASDVLVAGHTASAGLDIRADNLKDYQYYDGTIRGKAAHCIRLGKAIYYCGIPIEDVASEIAKDDKTVFLIGVTGVGKSLMLARAIGLSHKRKPLTDCIVMTHKTPNHADGEIFNYAGMEHTKRSSDYFEFAAEGEELHELVDERSALVDYISRISSAIKTGKPDDAPMLAVIDEYGNGLGAIKDLGAALVAQSQKDVSAQLSALYKRVVRKTITQGNSNKVRALITSHSSVADELEMTVDQRRNARFVYLGRGGLLDSIESVLDATRKMMSSDEASELREIMSRYKRAHRQMGSPENVVLALTNVNSVSWRLVVVSQNLEVEKIKYTASNPPEGTIGFTGADADEVPAFPETDLPTIVDDEEKLDLMNLEEPIESIEQTRASLDRLLASPVMPNEFTQHPEMLSTGLDAASVSEGNDINKAEPDDNDLLGGDAPSWMTYSDFHYLLNKLEAKIATPDGLLLSHFSNGCWQYKSSGGKHNPERLLEALRFFEDNAIVTLEGDAVVRVYFNGTDHIQHD